MKNLYTKSRTAERDNSKNSNEPQKLKKNCKHCGHTYMREVQTIDESLPWNPGKLAIRLQRADPQKRYIKTRGMDSRRWRCRCGFRARHASSKRWRLTRVTENKSFGPAGYGHGSCEETPRQVPQPHGNPVTADAYTQTHGALWPQEPINQELDEHEHHHPHFIHSSSAILPWRHLCSHFILYSSTHHPETHLCVWFHPWLLQFHPVWLVHCVNRVGIVQSWSTYEHNVLLDEL